MNFALRLYRDDDVQRPLPVEPRGVGISAAMSLSAFCREYYFPIVLELWTPEDIEESDDADEIDESGNAKVYLKALDYWAQFTGDPPLHQIDDLLIAKFRHLLRTTPIGRRTKKLLTEATVVKNLACIRAVLFRAGPDTDPKRPAKGLLTKIPHLVISGPPHPLPRPRFSVDQARAMRAACDVMAERSKFARKDQQGDGGPDAPQYWRALLDTAYYTGLRRGTLLLLERNMIQRDEDGHRLYVPGSAVEKTHKFSIKALRPELLETLQGLPRSSTAPERFFPWAFTKDHLLARHRKLQLAAGIAADETRDFHAWKRTHVKEVGRLGLDEAMRTAQRTGDHADRKTTEDHYCNLGQEAARLLPSLLPPPPPAPVAPPKKKTRFIARPRRSAPNTRLLF